ncbi:MAG: RHS repeat-associated core domain-containing protein [Hyphomicrobium sp.]
MGLRTTVDRPIAVVSNVNVSPALLMVHVDQLNRPLKMTDASRAVVWDAVWLPWGGAYAITGSQSLDARFPGQWFQLEAGLHYNWHRHYDPSLGRYTQPDPLSLLDTARESQLSVFKDGPSLFSYSKNQPLTRVDPKGLMTWSEWTNCVALDAATTLICKPILPLDNRCRWVLDGCDSIKDKMRRIRLCITLQTQLTSRCFPNDKTHGVRIIEEEQEHKKCEQMFHDKGCDQCQPH